MIRKIVVTSLLVVCALSAAAQRPRARIEWGVLGGINIPDYTTNMSGTDVKNKLGWQAGITTAVNLGAFAVEPQILYVRQGLRIRPEGQKEINLKPIPSTCRCCLVPPAASRAPMPVPSLR